MKIQIKLILFTLIAVTTHQTLAQESPMYFSPSVEDKISLYDNRLGATSMYGFGIEASTLYSKSAGYYRWYIGTNADGGASDAMQLSSGNLSVNGRLTLGGSDPYVKINDNTKHLVLSGGSGWTNTGAVILLSGSEKSFAPSSMQFYTGSGLAMRINSSQNVGIGTNTPDHKLDVKGTIRAEEVIVETGWSDFVFEDDYKLISLNEVESHIVEHGHLPGVPSASIVESEGLSLGEAQKIMMQKIEELTLYVIAQDKKIEAQQLRIQELESN